MSIWLNGIRICQALPWLRHFGHGLGHGWRILHWTGRV